MELLKAQPLTIAIPTFNRKASVERVLKRLLNSSLPNNTQIMILDDGSQDDTYEFLLSEFKDFSNVKVFKNDRNLGYLRTFVRLFELCETEYMLITTDDDEILADDLAILQGFLSQSRPHIVVPQFYHHGFLYRGRDKLVKVAPTEFFEATSHAPGLVFNVNACRNNIDLLRRRDALGCSYAYVYPQVVLTIAILCSAGEVWYWPYPIARTGEENPSGIKSPLGNCYWSVESRLQQFFDLDQLLFDGMKLAVTPREQLAYSKLWNFHAKQIFPRIWRALRENAPHLTVYFTKGTLRFLFVTYARAAYKKIMRRQLKR